MKFIKYAYMAIIRKPFLTIIFLIQIIVSSNIIYSVIDLNKQISEKIDSSINGFKDKKIYCMNLSGDTGRRIFKGKINHEDINKAYKMIKEGEHTHFFTHTDNFEIKDFKNSDSFRSNTYENEINGTRYIDVREYNIDESLYNYLNIKLFSGNGFKSSDFETLKEIKPCIIGYSYKDMYSVGDKIMSIDRKTLKPIYFEIVGIMPEGFKIINEFNSEEKFINTDKYIIFPIMDIDKFNQLNLQYSDNFGKSEFYLFNNSYFVFNESKSDNEINSFFNTMNNKLEELGIGKQRVTSIDDMLRQDLDFLYSNRNRALKTGLIVILFLALGIVTSTIYNVNKSKKQYGVYLMSGATIKDISIIIICKNVIIFALGFLISIGYLKFIYNQFKGIDIGILMQTFSIIMILCLVTLIIPTIKIFKLKVTALIKED